MRRLNDFLHGEADEVANILSSDPLPVSTQEMQALLTNAFRRIARIEKAWNAEHPEAPLP